MLWLVCWIKFFSLPDLIITKLNQLTNTWWRTKFEIKNKILIQKDYDKHSVLAYNCFGGGSSRTADGADGRATNDSSKGSATLRWSTDRRRLEEEEEWVNGSLKLQFYMNKSSLELRSSRPSVLYSLSPSSGVPPKAKPIEKQPAPSPKPPQLIPEPNPTARTTPTATPEIAQQLHFEEVHEVLTPVVAQQSSLKPPQLKVKKR